MQKSIYDTGNCMRSIFAFMISLCIFPAIASAQCATPADQVPCDDIVGISELMAYIDIWYSCSSCAPNLLGAINAYYNTEYGNESFSFMFMGDDYDFAASTVRFAYTNHPDTEIIFWIPDNGRVTNFNQIRNEWQRNPNAGNFTPLFLGLGNHDAEVMAVVNYSVEVLGPNLTRALPGMRNFREGPYDTYPNGYQDRNLTYSFDYKNAHFIMMYPYYHDLLLNISVIGGICGARTSANRFVPDYGPTGCMSQDMLDWLEYDLSHTDAKFKFMFYHEGAQPAPGGRHTGDSLDCIYCPGNWVERSWSNRTRPPMTERFWSLLAKYNVTANFVGHAHHNTLTWANDLFGGNGAVYEVEAGNPPRLAVVNIRGDDAVLRLYNANYIYPQYVQFEPFGPIVLSEDPINNPPKLYQHSGGNEAGFPVVDKRSYTLEVGQSLTMGSTLWFEAKDSDREDNLTFSISNLPSFLAVNDPSISYSFGAQWTGLYRRILLTTNTSSSDELTAQHIGNYSFDITVSDGRLSDSVQVDMSVVPPANPVLLGASIPNGTTIQFPMNRDNIYFACYDGESGPAILRYNGYRVNYNGQPVGCCSMWHSYSGSTVSDNLAFSEFFFPDDSDSVKDVTPGRYDITAFCGDLVGGRSNNFTLTVFLSNTTTISRVFGSWPTNGAGVEELDRMSFWAEGSIANLPHHLLARQVEVRKDGNPFADYSLISRQYNGSLSWGSIDIVFNFPASKGFYEFIVNETTFNVTVGEAGIPENAIFVDNTIPSDCASYNENNRSCGSGTRQAYSSISEASGIAAAGDTVLVRGGTYAEAIVPSNSGTPLNPITFRNYAGETAAITGAYVDGTQWGDEDGWVFGFYVWGKSNIVFEGLSFEDVAHGWGRIVHSSNITIRDSRFENAGATGMVGSIYFINSSHNRILNNTIRDGNDNLAFVKSDFNLIEGNNVSMGRHVLWTFKCSGHNIIRGNYFYNEIQKIGEIYDCEHSSDIDHFGLLMYNATKRNIVEGNTFAYTAPDDGDGPFNGIQYAGQEGIIRNNLFYDSHGIGLGMANYPDEAMYNLYNRVYGNVFYDNMGGGIITGTSNNPANFADNIFTNNIFYKNYPIPIGWADNHESGSQISSHNMANFLFANNSILNVTPGESTVIWDAYNHRISLSAAQTNYPSLYSGNVEANPIFMNEMAHDFRLQPGSPIINAGAFLTRTVGAGPGASMQVADAKYFYDGYGIEGERGDMIQLQGGGTARITAINYATNTLALDRSLNWNSEQLVSLAYSGSAPDIGAYESG